MSNFEPPAPPPPPPPGPPGPPGGYGAPPPGQPYGGPGGPPYNVGEAFSLRLGQVPGEHGPDDPRRAGDLRRGDRHLRHLRHPRLRRPRRRRPGVQEPRRRRLLHRVRRGRARVLRHPAPDRALHRRLLRLRPDRRRRPDPGGARRDPGPGVQHRRGLQVREPRAGRRHQSPGRRGRPRRDGALLPAGHRLRVLQQPTRSTS
ncbi:hypothetical protein G5V59_16700 [Nocardioides sp. W3-2-3]|nr:hypothetical protein [Nocardioides convexus]